MLDTVNRETLDLPRAQADRPKVAASFHDADLPDLSHVASPVPYMTRKDKAAAGLGAFMTLAPLAAAAWGSYFV